MIIGLDARPALFGRTGFGRVVRETLRSLAVRPDLDVRPYTTAWRRARPDSVLEGGGGLRLPARLQQWLAPLGFGVETLLGPLDVYHHTDLVFAPVTATPEVLTIYDLVFLQDARWHGAGFAKRVMARLAPRAKAARQIVVPCARVADAVLKHGLAPAQRVTVAELGADHIEACGRADDRARVQRLLQAAGLDPTRGDPLVLLPGTREPRKNQRALIEAFRAETGGDGATLLLVGPRGWGCEVLEAELAEPTAWKQGARPVGTVGEVPEEDLAALFRSCDLVAYPSFAEGFGLPVAEAMRCGRAVLTSVDSPMADFGGEAVLTVDPHDVRALSSAMERLLADPDLRHSLGEAAASRIASYTWKAHTDVLVDVYRSVLS